MRVTIIGKRDFVATSSGGDHVHDRLNGDVERRPATGRRATKSMPRFGSLPYMGSQNADRF